MEFENYRSNHIRKIQKQIAAVCWAGALISLAVQVCVFFMYYFNGFWKKGLIDYSISLYVWRGIIRPGIFVVASSVCCTAAAFSKKISENARNYVVCFSIMVSCSSIAICNVYFSFVMYLISFPIFTSMIFGNRRLLRIVSIADIIPFILSAVAFNMKRTDLDGTHRIISLVVLGSLLIVSYIISNALAKSQEIQFQYIFSNYKKQKLLIEELKIEPMTQLYNKSALEGCLKSCVRKFLGGNFFPLIAILDIDHFKLVNDTYGHSAGDEVLVVLASILKNRMGGRRHAFRFGGEEFLLVFENETLDFVKECVQEMNDEFKATDFAFAEGCHFSFSAGISALKENMDKSAWFDSADAALYRAKEGGRNRIEVAD